MAHPPIRPGLAVPVLREIELLSRRCLDHEHVGAGGHRAREVETGRREQRAVFVAGAFLTAGDDEHGEVGERGPNGAIARPWLIIFAALTLMQFSPGPRSILDLIQVLIHGWLVAFAIKVYRQLSR